MKAFADNSLYLIPAVEFVLNVEENTAGKRERVKYVNPVFYSPFINSLPNNSRLVQIERICRQQN